MDAGAHAQARHRNLTSAWAAIPPAMPGASTRWCGWPRERRLPHVLPGHLRRVHRGGILQRRQLGEQPVQREKRRSVRPAGRLLDQSPSQEAVPEAAPLSHCAVGILAQCVRLGVLERGAGNPRDRGLGGGDGGVPEATRSQPAPGEHHLRRRGNLEVPRRRFHHDPHVRPGRQHRRLHPPDRARRPTRPCPTTSPTCWPSSASTGRPATSAGIASGAA